MNLEIGVIRRNEIPSQCAPASVAEAAAFASSLAARYQPQTFVASQADLALACQPPGQANQYYNSQRIEISPEVTLQDQYFYSARAHAGEPAKPPVARYDEAAAARLFQRLFARHVRVLSFDSPVAAALPANPAVAQSLAVQLIERVQSVERLLPRSAVPSSLPATPIASPAFAPSLDTGWGMPLPTREPAQPATLAGPEIQRVAQQVMREIDHRARARRERTGRAPR